MFFVTLLAIVVGVCLGIITGIAPGIHVNLISVLLLSVSPVLLEFVSPLTLCATIAAMAVTHTFLDTIPSVFLGAPTEETVMSSLPSHRLLAKGRAMEAVLVTLFGSYFGLLCAVALVPVFVYLVALFEPAIHPYIGWLLLVLSIFLILREKEILWCLFVFVLSGVLGLVVFDLPLQEPLFPLLSGLFGVAGLLIALKEKVSVPRQQPVDAVELHSPVKPLAGSVVIGWFASFLPGLGPSQGAAVASHIIKLGDEGFMILVGGLSTVNMVLSFVTFYVIDKARSGPIVTISELIDISFLDFVTLLTVSLIAGSVATILTILLSKKFGKVLHLLPYHKLCIAVLGFICVLVVLITGWLGLLVLVVSGAVGLVPVTKNVPRSHMMGCLLIPVMLYFLM